MVARLAKAGMKAAKLLFALKGYEGEVVLENVSRESISFPKRLEEFSANYSLDLGTLEWSVLLLFFNLFPFSTRVRSSSNNCCISCCL